MVDVVDSKSTAGDSVPVRVRSPAPINPIVNDTFTMGFILCWKRTRTHSSGTVRWTVPATSANTGGYLYFLPSAENANRVLLPAPKRLHESEAFFHTLPGGARRRAGACSRHRPLPRHRSFVVGGGALDAPLPRHRYCHHGPSWSPAPTSAHRRDTPPNSIRRVSDTTTQRQTILPSVLTTPRKSL